MQSSPTATTSAHILCGFRKQYALLYYLRADSAAGLRVKGSPTRYWLEMKTWTSSSFAKFLLLGEGKGLVKNRQRRTPPFSIVERSVFKLRSRSATPTLPSSLQPLQLDRTLFIPTRACLLVLSLAVILAFSTASVNNAAEPSVRRVARAADLVSTTRQESAASYQHCRQAELVTKDLGLHSLLICSCAEYHCHIAFYRWRPCTKCQMLCGSARETVKYPIRKDCQGSNQSHWIAIRLQFRDCNLHIAVTPGIGERTGRLLFRTSVHGN